MGHSTTLDDYHVLEIIGEGSFGKVYRGRKRFTGQMAALKFINKKGKSAKEVTTLRQEMTILSTLEHDNIIRWLDNFETDTDFIVVTELAQGELFHVLDADKRLPEKVVKDIARQLVQALWYLHTRRIIHRDMKPQNILVAANGVVKLCDFGFARATSSNTIMLTSIKGTPLYMAPELVREDPYDHRVDLWSLGVILFELYKGEPPFFTNSIYSLINHIMTHPVQYPKSISSEFHSFLRGLLEKDMTKRLDWPKLAQHPFVSLDEELTRAGEPGFPNRLQGGLEVIAEENSAEENAAEAPAVWPPPPPVQCETPQSKPRRAVAQTAHPGVRPVVPLRPGRECPPPPSPQLATPRSPLAETQATSPTPQSQHNGFRKPPSTAPVAVGRARTRLRMDEATVEKPARHSAETAAQRRPDQPPVAVVGLADAAQTLLVAEAEAGSSSGANALWGDKRTVPAALQLLAVPAAGPKHMNFEHDDFQRALKVSINMLRHGLGRSQSVPLQLGLAAAIRGAAVASPSTAVAAVDFLRYTESHLAEALAARHSSVTSDTFIALEESPRLYAQLLTTREGSGQNPWSVVGAAADGMAGILRRAQHVLADATAGQPARERAEGILATLLHEKVIHTLVRCTADAAGASEAACSSAISALAAAVHVPAAGSTSARAAEAFPLSLGLSVGGIAAPAISLPGVRLRRPHSLLRAAAETTGACLAERRTALRALRSRLVTVPKTADAGSRSGSGAVTVLRAACAASPAACEAAIAGGLPQALVQAANGQPGTAEAALALWAIAQVAVAAPGSHQQQKPHMFGSPEGLTAALQRLLAVLQAVGSDAVASSAAAGALGAVVALHQGFRPADASLSPQPRAVGPPPEVFGTSALAALRTLLGLGSRMARAPAFEAAEGSGATTGLLDGPVGLAAALLAAGGPAAEPGQAVIRTNVGNLVLNLLQEAAEVPPGVPLAELSPGGARSLVAAAALLAAPEGLSASVLLRKGMLPGALALLGPAHLRAVSGWLGAGEAGAVQLAGAVVDLLIGPLWPSAALPEGHLQQYQKALAAADAVGVLTRALTALPASGAARVLELAHLLVGWERRLGRQFAQQFIAAGGLQAPCLARLIGAGAPVEALEQGLTLLSNVARVDERSYAPLASADICAHLRDVLGHEAAGVRAAAAGVVGNLARHSPALYATIARERLLPRLIQLCGDADAGVRKFACFAVGLLAFHGVELYCELVPAVAPLVCLLADSASRNQSNAAGALGNLSRHADTVVPAILRAGAVQAMAQALLRLEPASAHPTDVQLTRNLIFSFIQLAQWPAAVKALAATGMGQRLQEIGQRSPNRDVRPDAERLLRAIYR